MKIQDVTIYSKEDKERTPKIVRFTTESGVIFTIHKHMYYPNKYYPETWLISSIGICDNVDLNTDDFEEAKVRGINHIKSILDKKIMKYQSAVEELDKLIEQV